MQDVLAIVRDFLAGRHTAAKCPCRKTHHVAPKPAAPDAPPNCGKLARRLREAIDQLVAARDLGDDNAVIVATKNVEFNSRGFEDVRMHDYRFTYERYIEAMAMWSPEICGDCGASLLAITGQGCAACLSADAEELLKRLEEHLEKKSKP